MSELERMGITVQRSVSTSATEMEGVAIGGSESTELAFTLPKTTPIHATFSREGLGKKLVKIFKKEIQTGDVGFDATVYVSTDTPAETAAMLQSDVVRGALARIVDAGGWCELEGAFMRLVVAGRHESEDDVDTVALVRALLS